MGCNQSTEAKEETFDDVVAPAKGMGLTSDGSPEWATMEEVDGAEAEKMKVSEPDEYKPEPPAQPEKPQNKFALKFQQRKNSFVKRAEGALEKNHELTLDQALEVGFSVEMFEQADTDNSGTVDMVEFKAIMEQAKETDLDRIAAIKSSHPGNLAIKHFDVDYYNSLDAKKQNGLLRCLSSGIANPDSGMGCYAMQPADYDNYKPFFSKVLSEYHKVTTDAFHVNNWSLDGVEGLPEGGVLDLAALGLPELSMRVRVGRNLKDFPLPGAMSKANRVAMETKMCTAFEVLKAKEEFGGGYNSLTPGHADFVNDAQYKELVAAHIMFKDMAADTYLASAGIASDWPHGRGCYVSGDKQFIIWVGEEDHLRIMCMKKGAVLNEVFDRLKSALDVVNAIDGLEFASSPDYGMVTSCPTNLGTGMRASVHIPIPNLTADGTDAKAKEICKPLGLSVRGTGGEHTPIGADGTCDISPSARFIISEAEIITALYNGLKLLKEEEEKAGAATAEAEADEEDETPAVAKETPAEMVDQ